MTLVPRICALLRERGPRRRPGDRPAGSFPTTTSRPCGRPASPRSSGPARRSARSPTSSGPTSGRSPERGRVGVPADAAAHGLALAEAVLAGDRRALARLLTAVENRTRGRGDRRCGSSTRWPGGRTSSASPARRAPARARSSPRSSARSARSGRTGGGDRRRPVLADHRRGAPRRPRADAGRTPATTASSSGSMASRGHAGGLRRHRSPPRPCSTPPASTSSCLETVGTGQSEVEVAAAADTTVVLEAPEMGDEVQAIKAGLLEVADIVVVNKGDRPGAQRAAAELRAMLSTAGGRVARPAPGAPRRCPDRRGRGGAPEVANAWARRNRRDRAAPAGFLGETRAAPASAPVHHRLGRRRAAHGGARGDVAFRRPAPRLRGLAGLSHLVMSPTPLRRGPAAKAWNDEGACR